MFLFLVLAVFGYIKFVLSPRPAAAVSKDGSFKIDADPDAFSVILNWLRRRRVMLTSRTSLENVEVEADFYGLVELKREVRKMIVEAEAARVEEEKRRAERTMTLDPELSRRLEEISGRLEGITVDVKEIAVNVLKIFQYMP